MKSFIKLTICLILITSVLVGCTTINNTEDDGLLSEKLINADVADIDIAQIDKLSAREQYQDESVISEVVEKLSGIKLIELTEEKGVAIIQDEENNMLYNISLFSEGNLVGSALVFSGGEIIFTDTKTIEEGKAVSYINEEEIKDKHQAIVSYLDGLE